MLDGAEYHRAFAVHSGETGPHAHNALEICPAHIMLRRDAAEQPVPQLSDNKQARHRDDQPKRQASAEDFIAMAKIMPNKPVGVSSGIDFVSNVVCHD